MNGFEGLAVLVLLVLYNLVVRWMRPRPRRWRWQAWRRRGRSRPWRHWRGGGRRRWWRL